MNASDVRAAAGRVNDSAATRVLARLGYVASGLVHVLLGVIALQVAWFHSSESADQSGAFGMLASQPLGKVALWAAAVGFVGLAVWQVTEAVAARKGAGAGDRVKAASKAVVYAALAWTALQFATGSSTQPDQQSQDFTAKVMAHTGGRWAVGVVGVVVVGVGAYHVYKGWTRKFLEDLTRHPGQVVTVLGRVGYVAKGIALGIVGALFVVAAVQQRPDQAGGLDDALRSLREQPFGPVLLTVVALGVIAYGLYSFARARFART